MTRGNYGTYIGNNKMLIYPFWGGKLVAPSEDLSLMPDLVIEGAFDMGLTNYILRNIRNGMTVVDVGANIGYITVLLGHQVGSQGKVIGYECSPNNYSFLEENIMMNYHGQTKIYQKAIDSSEGKTTFYEPHRFRGNGSIHSDIVNSFKENVKFDHLNEITVETITLDEHLKANNIEKISFMKMDIEGFEYQAFKGMKNYIDQGKIDVISFELNQPALKDDKYELLDLMNEFKQKFNATFYTINLEGGLVSENINDIFLRNHVDNLVVKFR